MVGFCNHKYTYLAILMTHIVIQSVTIIIILAEATPTSQIVSLLADFIELDRCGLCYRISSFLCPDSFYSIFDTIASFSTSGQQSFEFLMNMFSGPQVLYCRLAAS